MRKSTFWMVYGEGCGAPTRKHETLEDADREARRLARNNPERWFYVLEAIGGVRKSEFQAVSFRADGRDYDEIPF